ncbi:MAG: hypothetical protein R3F55_18090 [Alphaproteobacteria bacterium]
MQVAAARKTGPYFRSLTASGAQSGGIVDRSREMGLPSPEQLAELGKQIAKQGQLCHGAWEKFKSVQAALRAKLGPMAIQQAATHAISAAGVSSGVHVGVAIGGVAIGTTLAPIGAALGPWIGAAIIANQAGKIFSLYDLKADAQKSRAGNVDYTCRCGACASNIGYVIDKKERNAALVAISVGTVGAATIFKGIHSAGKKLYSKLVGQVRPKERVSRDLVTSARGGCTAAMGAVFLLSGSWSLTGDRDAETMTTAVAILTSDDGWEKLRSLW